MQLRQDDLFSTQVEGQTVLLDARSSRYLTANAVGTFILEVLADDVSLIDISERVQAEFGVDSETALGDCQRFVEQLRDHDMLLDERD